MFITSILITLLFHSLVEQKNIHVLAIKEEQKILTSITKDSDLPRILDKVLQKKTKSSAKNQDFNTRIVGGERAPKDAYPWFAILAFQNGSFLGCGGMLVAPQYVLTAAHCVSPGTPWSVQNGATVILGLVCEDDESNCDQPYEIYSVQEITPHPDYSPESSDNDYALARLVGRSDREPVAM